METINEAVKIVEYKGVTFSIYDDSKTGKLKTSSSRFRARVKYQCPAEFLQRLRQSGKKIPAEGIIERTASGKTIEKASSKLKDKINLILKEVQNTHTGLTLDRLYDLYWQNERNNGQDLAKRTIEKYDYTRDKIANHVASIVTPNGREDFYLGKMMVKDIKRTHYKVWLDSFTVTHVNTKGILVEGGLAKNTVKSINSHAKQVLTYAYNEGYIDRNLTSGVIIQGRAEAEPESKYIQEYHYELYRDKLLYMIDTSDYRTTRGYIALLICGQTGARIGEVLSLDVDDLDFEDNKIKISKTYDYRNKAMKDSTKTYTTRTVSIDGTTMKIIKQYINSLNLKEAPIPRPLYRWPNSDRY